MRAGRGRRKRGSRSRHDAIAGSERRRGACRQPLEVGEGKEKDSSLDGPATGPRETHFGLLSSRIIR